MNVIFIFTNAVGVFNRAVNAYRDAARTHGDHEARGRDLDAAFAALKRAAPAAVIVQSDLRRVLADAANDFRQCRQIVVKQRSTMSLHDRLTALEQQADFKYKYDRPKYDGPKQSTGFGYAQWTDEDRARATAMAALEAKYGPGNDTYQMMKRGLI